MDRDYYSASFLDWFPGNIQLLNSIASVLHYPPRQQNNETADRAGDSETGRFAVRCGETSIVNRCCHKHRRWLRSRRPSRANRPAAGSQQSVDSQQIRRRRINIHVRCRSDFTLTDVPISDFMMKVNNWFHYKPIDYKMGERANSLSARGRVCAFSPLSRE